LRGGLAIDISGELEAWESALPEVANVIRRAARSVWLAESTDAGNGIAEVSVVLADDEMVHELNRHYRGRDKPTNVLAFPAEDAGGGGRPRLLGDVVFALETVRREAAEQSKPLADHLSHLVVHGMLHLLGHDHETDVQAAAMEAQEIAILAGLGLANPYLAVEDAADLA